MYRNDLKESIDSVINFEALYDKTFLITGAVGTIASFLLTYCYMQMRLWMQGLKCMHWYAIQHMQKYVFKRF